MFSCPAISFFTLLSSHLCLLFPFFNKETKSINSQHSFSLINTMEAKKKDN